MPPVTVTNRTVPGYLIGHAAQGEAGGATASITSLPLPTVFPANTVHLVGGKGFTLALTSGGEVWGWGDNRHGQLGDGTKQPSGLTPRRVKIPDGRPVVAVDAAGHHAAAVTVDGDVFAWGGGSAGWLAPSSNTDHLLPVWVRLPGDHQGATVAVGARHLVILSATGEVVGLGDNTCGQLGGPRHRFADAQVLPNLPTQATAISAGGYHSLIVTGGDTTHLLGQLGANQPASPGFGIRLETEQVVAVSSGVSHAVALTRGGQVREWRDSASVDRTSRSFTDPLSPAQVRVPRQVTAISAAGTSSIALDDDGSVWTWGIADRWVGPGESAAAVQPHEMSALRHASVTSVAATDDHLMVAVRPAGRHLILPKGRR